MNKKQRRGVAEVSVSFLDVISCGFGAIVPPWYGKKSLAVTTAVSAPHYPLEERP